MTKSSSVRRVPSDPSHNLKDLPTLDLAQLRRLAIQRAMTIVDGDVEAAATLLGIGRATLYRHLAGQRKAEQEARVVSFRGASHSKTGR